MDKDKLIQLVLTEWVANLRNRDRSHKNVRPHFEELFQKWKDIDATFDETYETFLPKAIKAHQPVSSVARNSYKKLKQVAGPKLDKTEKEFIEEWNKSIEDTGTSTYFEFFPPPTLDKDTEPKVYGNMSASEYRAQRRYVEQFPILDTTELEKRWHEQQYNLDIEDMIKTVLGSDDETNS
jgi:hypothetical protein